MCHIRNRSLLPTLFIVCSICLAMSAPAQASSTTIPWMTGSFFGQGSFVLFPGVTSPDGQWFFNMETAVVEGKTVGEYECGNGMCTFYGFAPITGGTADGNLYHWNGSSFDPFATFTGWVTGGGVDKTEVYTGDVLTQYNHQYRYDFVGAWSNQWHTSGSVYTWGIWDGINDPGGGSYFDVTTQTPEPGTILLLGSGLLGLAGVIRTKS